MKYQSAEELWRGEHGYAYYNDDLELPILEVTVEFYDDDTADVCVMPANDFTHEFADVIIGAPFGACGGVMSNAVHYDGKLVGYAEGRTDEQWHLSLAEVLMGGEISVDAA